ncbi:MAG: hypothetical protein FJ125_07480, partial [Deltaproteobacteria bacterium]|nr:hypothetical protein [Deltaproteobacteria bacterium]
AIIGGLFAMLVQGTGLGAVIEAAHGGYVSRSGLEALDSLLSRGGLNSMMSTVALVMCALSFGGIMEATGMLAVLARAILRLATTTGRLVVCTISTCVGMNVIAPDQYLSIVVPGRMYRDAFRKQGLDLKNLSRCLEDAGTLSSPLVPWNTCGAYMYATLGVSPLAYLPFAFVNLLNPCISILYGFTGWTMHPAEEEAADEAALVTGITVAAEDGDETPTRADAAAGGGSAGSISSGTRAEGNT